MAGSGPGCPQPCQRMERGRRGTWELGLTSHCPSPSTLRSTHMQTCSCRQAHMWLADAQRPTDRSMSTCMAPITRNRVLSHPRPYVTQTERHRRMAHTLTHRYTSRTHACSHTHMLPRSMEKQGTCTHIHTQAYPEKQSTHVLKYSRHTQSTQNLTHCSPHTHGHRAEAHRHPVTYWIDMDALNTPRH